MNQSSKGHFPYWYFNFLPDWFPQSKNWPEFSLGLINLIWWAIAAEGMVSLVAVVVQIFLWLDEILAKLKSTHFWWAVLCATAVGDTPSVVQGPTCATLQFVVDLFIGARLLIVTLWLCSHPSLPLVSTAWIGTCKYTSDPVISVTQVRCSTHWLSYKNAFHGHFKIRQILPHRLLAKVLAMKSDLWLQPASSQ